MYYYPPTEEEIQQANEDFVREVARIRERHRLKQLHGENYVPPVDPNAPEEEDTDPTGEKFMEALEWMRRGRLPPRPRE